MNKNISLVIINEDGVDYLPRLFESLKNQTLDVNLDDVVFVDNCSSDDSARVAAEFGINNIHVVSDRIDRRGVLYRIGADKSNGDYVMFAHSDIYFDFEFFVKLREKLAKGDDPDFVNFAQYYADHSLVGNNQVGFGIEKKSIYYRQLFQTLPVAPDFECSEGCFMVKSGLLEELDISDAYRWSFFEYELIKKIGLNSGKIVDWFDSKFTHYFLENHEKIKALDFDRRAFIINNEDLFVLKEKEVSCHRLGFELEQRGKWAKGLEKELGDRTEWAKGLEKELGDRTEWGKGLEKELGDRTEWGKGLEKELADRTEWGKGLEKELAERTIELKGKGEFISSLEADLEVAMQKLADFGEKLVGLNSYIDDRHYEIQCLTDTVQQREARINAIERSFSYKLGRVLTWPARILFPVGSKREVLLKIMGRFLRGPINFLKHLKRGVVKNFFVSLYEDRPDIVMAKFDSCLKRDPVVNADQTEFSGSDQFEIYENLDTTKKLVFKLEENPTVSIVIPVYNNWELNYACLYSILENSGDVSYEVIIGDDLSSDETENISDVVGNIVVVRHKENLRFLKNCNEAAKVAKGKYILFLNNDTNVQKNWLKSLVDLIESDEKIGMVGSKLVYPNGQLQEAGGIIWNDASGWNYGRLGDPDLPQYNYVKEVDYISGAAIMIRRNLWEEIGGFDELYVPAYYEDSDLAFEVRKRGYKVMYQPKSVVVHFEGMSHGTDSESGLKAYQVENREKFLKKWKDVLEEDHFEPGENVFWARDRSKGKKTILVIDHYVPTYDKDAGSRTQFQYIKLFLEMEFNVKFLGDNFAKTEPYATELSQIGVEVLYGPWYQSHWQKWIKDNAKYLDYVYLHRSHIALKYIDFVKENTDAKILYNAVDFSFLREERQYEITGDRKYLKQALDSRNREFEVFEKSDTVLTISEFEKDFLNKAMPDKEVHVIPTFIYDSTKLPEGRAFDGRKGLTFVGGFGHTPNVDAVLWFVKEVFPDLQKMIEGLVFNVIGSNPTDEILALKSESVNVTGFVSDQELEKYYAKSRLVVAPLRFGAGVKGKIIEAVAHGLPVVSTKIGIEGMKAIEGAVKVAETADEFIQEIVALYNESREWRSLNGRGKDYIKNHLSEDCARKVINSVFQS